MSGFSDKRDAEIAKQQLHFLMEDARMRREAHRLHMDLMRAQLNNIHAAEERHLEAMESAARIEKALIEIDKSLGHINHQLWAGLP